MVPVAHVTLLTCLINISCQHHLGHGHLHYHFRQEPAHTVVIHTLRDRGTSGRRGVPMGGAESGWDGV